MLFVWAVSKTAGQYCSSRSISRSFWKLRSGNGWRVVGNVLSLRAVGHGRSTSDELFQRAAYPLGCFRSKIGPVVTKSCLLAVSGTTNTCLLYTSPSPRDKRQSRMPSSA